MRRPETEWRTQRSAAGSPRRQGYSRDIVHFNATAIAPRNLGRLNFAVLRCSLPAAPKRSSPTSACGSFSARGLLKSLYAAYRVVSVRAHTSRAAECQEWLASQPTLVDDVVYYLKDFHTPAIADLRRDTTGAKGNLEGFYLRGILAGGDWAYSNPFAPAPLSDDEIAIATCLRKMDEYVRRGKQFYTLAEASQDHYLNLLSQQALKEGREINIEPQWWTRAVSEAAKSTGGNVL